MPTMSSYRCYTEAWNVGLGAVYVEVCNSITGNTIDIQILYNKYTLLGAFSEILFGKGTIF